MSNNIAYPFPVMGNGDDVGGEFKVSPDVTIEHKKITIKLSFEVDNETMDSLIKKDMARFVVDVRSRGTFLRKTFSTNETELEIELNAQEVRYLLEMSYYVVATKEIADYCPVKMNEIFGDASFVVKPGEVIAMGGSSLTSVELEFDPMVANASSFIVVNNNPNVDVITVEYESDLIVINIPSSVYDDYSAVSGVAVDTVHASIILPALVDAIYKIRDPDNDFQQYLWYLRIREICEARKIDLQEDEALEIAQKLLRDPVKRSMYSLRKMQEEDIDE